MDGARRFGRIRTVHLDPALPFVLELVRLFYCLLRVRRRRRGRRGRGGCAPGWREEVDEEVREERERRGVALIASVRRVREELDDREREVVWWREDVRCGLGGLYVSKVYLCSCMPDTLNSSEGPLSVPPSNFAE